MLDKIKALCKEQGISVNDLEAKLGFGNGSIYRWDITSPSVAKVEQVAAYFNVPIDYILGNMTKDDVLQTAFDKRPEMRMLFSVAENATKEDIEKAIKIIEALKG